MIPAHLPPNEDERLGALERYAILDSSPELCFDDLVRLAAMTCRVPFAFISLVARDRQWFKARLGVEFSELPRELSFCAHTILGDGPLIIADTAEDVRFADNPLVASEPRIRFYAGTPLFTQNHVALGALAVLDVEPRELTAEQTEALGILGRQVMAQLDLRRQLIEQRHLAIEVDRGLEALRKSESEARKLALVASRTNNAVVVTGADGLIQWVNDGFTRITGFTPAEARGKKAGALLEGPNTDPTTIEEMRACLADGRPFTGEILNYHKSGREFWMGVETQPLRDARGEVGGFMSIESDITEPRLAREALRESEERFRTMANAMPQLAWIAQPDGYVSWYNQRWYEYTGTTLEQMEGWGWQEVLDPEGQPVVLERWRHSLATGQPFELEFALRGGDGNFRRFLTRIVPLQDSSGRVVQWFGTNTDVEALKRVEQELQKAHGSLEIRVQERTRELATVTESLRAEVQERARAQERLRQVSDRLVLATQAGGIGIWDWDVPANAMLWDEGMQRLYGIGAEEFPRNIEGWELRLHQEDQAVKRAEIAQALRGEKDFDTEFRVVWPDQTVRHIKAHALVQRDGSGRPLRMLGTNWDITELKHVERKLQQSQASLEMANKELVAFSYSVSHDLRSPLRGIDGWSLALLEDYSDRLDDKGRGFLQRVRSETQRMGQLIDDLLQLSRVTQTEMRPAPVDLSAVAANISIRLREQEPGREVDFTIQPGLSARGDEGLLRAALANLFENAWKFTRKRSPAVIEFGRTEQANGSCFFVRDNGAGFDMAYASKLFAPFQRLHRITEYPGTGIGLATVQRVVQRHGGRIWAEAHVERGATFYFTLG